MTKKTSEPLPAIYRHCNEVYNLMREEAKPAEVESARMMVWEGFFVSLIREQLSLSTPYYTAIRKELIRMGCIRQLRRGGGTSTSQWELITPPTEELWHTKAALRSRQASRIDALEGQIRDLSDRLGTAERNILFMVEHLNQTKEAV